MSFTMSDLRELISEGERQGLSLVETKNGCRIMLTYLQRRGGDIEPNWFQEQYETARTIRTLPKTNVVTVYGDFGIGAQMDRERRDREEAELDRRLGRGTPEHPVDLTQPPAPPARKPWWESAEPKRSAKNRKARRRTR